MKLLNIDKKSKQEYLFYLLLAILTIIQFILLFKISLLKPVGFDDAYQISINLQPDIKDILYRLIRGDNTPPLFTLLSTPWIYLVPHSSIWLKLPSILFVTVGVYLCGIIGRRVNGEWCGIITALSAATSFQLMQRGAQNFRSYGLFFFLSCISIYVYILRRTHHDNKKWMILYTISLILLSYSHFFGVLVCIGLFLFDAFLFLIKKCNIKIIFCYICAGIAFLPWFITFYLLTRDRTGSFWPPVPGVAEYVVWLQEATGNPIFFAIYLTGTVLSILYVLYRLAALIFIKKTYVFSELFLMILNTYLVAFFVVTITFIYSKYLNPSASLWVERYFVGILPFVFLTLGIIISALLKAVKKRVPKFAFMLCSYAVLLFSSALLFYQNYDRLYKFEHIINDLPYESVATYLSSQKDYTNSDVIAITTNADHPIVWEYFFYPESNLAAKVISDEMATSDQFSLESIHKIYLIKNAAINPGFDLRLNTEYRFINGIPELCLEIYERK